MTLDPLINSSLISYLSLPQNGRTVHKLPRKNSTYMAFCIMNTCNVLDRDRETDGILFRFTIPSDQYLIRTQILISVSAVVSVSNSVRITALNCYDIFLSGNRFRPSFYRSLCTFTSNSQGVHFELRTVH